MIRKLISGLFMAILLCSNLSGQDNFLNELIRAEVSAGGQARVRILFPGKQRAEELTRNYSLSTTNGKTLTIVLSPLTVESFIKEGIEYEFIPSDNSKGIISARSVGEVMEWDSYPTYTQYVDLMQGFAAAYPELCQLDTIGTSVYGKLVLVCKISDNPGLDEDEPEVFYSSTIHGDETGGFILMLRLIDYLLTNYNLKAEIKHLVDNLQIWINPLANPDGTYRTGDVLSSPTRYNANGYDLNRNFPDPVTPNTVKQKETLDMVKFMRSRRIVLSANFHSGEEVVNYPWDRWSRLHPDDQWFYSISRSYADTAHLYAPLGYMTFLNNGVTNGYDWYSIYGGRQDFATWELQGREVTIELDDAYVTPASQLDNLWNYNYRSLLRYISNALYGIHGKILDNTDLQPVAAKIYISGHDTDSSHVYSDTLNGSFVRMLAPGTWDLRISANGYKDATVTGITVVEGQKTELTVLLTPILNPVDTVNTPVPVVYPNPAKDYVRVVLPERQYGLAIIRLYNNLGQKIHEYTTTNFEDIPLQVDLTGLPSGSYTLTITNTGSNITDRAGFVIVR
jgi:hypothetical protein